MLAVIANYKLIAWILFGLYLLSGSFMDLRSKSVPLWWLAAGSVLSAALFAAPFFGSGRAEIISRLAAALIGSLFLAFSVFAPESFGRADALLIIMMGLVCGVEQMLESLLIAFLLAGLFGLILGLAKKGKNMAFIPFLAAGFLGGGWMFI